MANLYIEDYLPVVSLAGGIKTQKPITMSGSSATLGTGTLTVTSSSASALTVGANGATNPVLKIDASASSVATGLTVAGAAAASGVAVTALSSGTNESLTLDAKGSGSISMNTTATGSVLIGRALAVGTVSGGFLRVTSTSATAFTAGANGSTNPVIQVDANTASVATGLKITGAAAASGVAVAAISSGTNENLTIDAKGSGTITLNNTGTGNIVLGRAMTGVSSSLTGGSTLKSGTAVPATAGAVAAGAPTTMYSSGITIEVTSDAPTHTRPKGSICINTGGSSSSTRLYVNTDGATTWTNVTTAA